jgi:septal ring factor EnvC (AmiA/AmiB activator)
MCDDINKQINELTDALNKSVAATKPLESELTNIQKQIAGIKSSIGRIEVDIAQKKINIDKGYKDIEKKQIILHKAISNFYVKSYSDSPFLVLLSGTTASQVTQSLVYQKAKTDQDKQVITTIALSISDLESKSLLKGGR